jgi:osmotically-inducible protein OsmY
MRRDGATRVYLAERVRAALAQDPLVSKLGVDVAIVAGKVVLRGDVATAERRERIGERVAELLPGLAVRNEIRVRELAPPASETLR